MKTSQTRRQPVLENFVRSTRSLKKYCIISLVCNFQSTKSPVELNGLLLKFFRYASDLMRDKLEALQTKAIFQNLLFHFPKIHRSVLCKITVDLFYF